MATWTATRGTDTLAFDGNPYKLVAIEGIGSPPMRRLDERGPLQDGVTDLGYRMDARIIDLVIWFQATSESVLDGYRDTLLEFFKPKSSTPVKLKVTRADNGVRQIDGFVTGAIDAPATAGDRPGAKAQKVGIQLRCANPIWYDPTPGAATFSTVFSEWRYGGGLIGTANLVSGTTNPASGLDTAAGTSSQWTIFARTSLPASGSGTAWTAGVKSASINSGGTTTLYSTGTFIAGANGVAAGTTSMFWVADDAYHRMYQEGTVRLSYYVGSALPMGGGSISWRDNGAGGGTYTPELTHAAVYNIALSETQRSGIINAIATTTGQYSGTVTMVGNWDEYPVITLSGPFNDPVITNHGTGEVLDFTGSTIAANEAYTIDTRYGYKTVTSQAGSNIISKLTDGSDLATFHLIPGGNFLQVSFTGGTAVETGVIINYFNRYIAP